MKLAPLLKSLSPTEVTGEVNVEVVHATSDSRKVQSGSVFVAIPGVEANGTDFVDDAIEAGAVAIIAQSPVSTPRVPVAVVSNARAAAAQLATTMLGDPSRRMTVIGITGTNGKTTTAGILEGILTADAHLVGVTGTLGVRHAGTPLSPRDAPGLTTPDPFEYQATLARFYSSGITHVISEVSSHALDQRRVDGTHFDVGVFTNLSQDHLDYHGDFHAYFAAKRRLFDALLEQSEKDVSAVINLDDSRGSEIWRSLTERVRPVTFSRDPHAGADIFAGSVTSSANGMEGVLTTPKGELAFQSGLVGSYNVSNILAATAAAIALDVSADAIVAGILGHPPVPGRLERVDASDLTILVDYAHTPDALANVLSVGREVAGDLPLVVVFGCGGDRDKDKRPKMGSVASRLADVVYITSDNPRSEDPQAIIDDIREGLETSGARVIVDRREAIHDAIATAQPGSVVVLAGKGHETYQVAGGEVHHFDDRIEAAAAVAARGTRRRDE